MCFSTSTFENLLDFFLIDRSIRFVFRLQLFSFPSFFFLDLQNNDVDRSRKFLWRYFLSDRSSISISDAEQFRPTCRHERDERRKTNEIKCPWRWKFSWVTTDHRHYNGWLARRIDQYETREKSLFVEFISSIYVRRRKISDWKIYIERTEKYLENG